LAPVSDLSIRSITMVTTLETLAHALGGENSKDFYLALIADPCAPLTGREQKLSLKESQ
jgi:hypothetical protein